MIPIHLVEWPQRMARILFTRMGHGDPRPWRYRLWVLSITPEYIFAHGAFRWRRKEWHWLDLFRTSKQLLARENCSRRAEMRKDRREWNTRIQALSE